MSNLKHGGAATEDRKQSNPRWRAHCAWVAMRSRCRYPGNPDYVRYGGRGITVDPTWENFQKFISDMGDPPPNTSLDRIDNDGLYCKENCRWASKTEQMRNRGNCRHLTYGGQTKTMAEWARRLGIGHSALSARLSRGWTVERALSERSGAPQIVTSPDRIWTGVLSMGA